jgi:indole-3-glycerol phosphate synthase
VAVISEVKRRSPSKGWLAEDLDAAATARLYADGGATAISVLTDLPHFGGTLDDLAAVRRAVDLPVLRKDFTVCENDVLDALEWGASAVLLIVALLSDDELARLHALARTVNLDALVEVHDEAEASRALRAGATLIGVNQRDLHTFAVDSLRAARVAQSLPHDVVKVAESGLRSADDVRVAGEAGFHAVLVGESFVTDASPGERVRDFAGVSRS